MTTATLEVAAAAANVPPAAASWGSKLAKEYGIFAVMVVFFVWWGYVREGQLNARNAESDKFIRETLVTTLDNNTKALEGFRAALDRLKDKSK